MYAILTPLKKQTSIMKRPLFISCLFISFIIIIITLSKDYISIDFPLEEYADDILVEGTVTDIRYSIQNDYTSVSLILDNIHILSGRSAYKNRNLSVIAYLSSEEDVPKIGSTITLHGKPYNFSHARNDGMFDYNNYYRSLGIYFGIRKATILSESDSYSHFYNFFFNLRRSLSSRLSLILPNNEASIMKTMLLGEKEAIDKDTKALYQRNGIAHILAISGLHISLLSAGLMNLLKFLSLSRKKSAIISLFIVFFYGFLTGFSFSNKRAIFMFIFASSAIVIGRSYDIMTSLSFVFMLSILENPLAIYNSGFIFSYGCVLGIAVISPTFKSKNMSFLRKNLINIFTMLVITLPLYMSYFYQLPLYSLLLNLLIIPSMSVLIPIGIITLSLSYLFPSISSITSLPLIGILKIYEKASVFAERLPFHFLTLGKPGFIKLFIFATAMILLYLLKDKLQLKIKIVFAISLMLLLTLRHNPKLSISFLDVSQGDCIYISSANHLLSFSFMESDFNMIIDCGSTTEKNVGNNILIPFIKSKGVSVIDAALFTHEDQDHINGLMELLENGKLEGIKVKSVILPESMQRNDEVKALCKENNIRIIYFSKGDSIDYKDLHLLCLSPESVSVEDSSNEDSLVMYLAYKDFSALFTGDIEGNAERELISTIQNSDIRNIDVLKVAHHGSKYSTSRELIELLDPDFSIISSGEGNSYGHPHKETLERLIKYAPETTILRTDECGQITILINRKPPIVTCYSNIYSNR